jgi:hypothetical protein
MSASSQATPAFGSQTYQIRVSTAAQPAFVKIGDGTPTADSTDSMLIGTNVVVFHSVARTSCGGTASGRSWHN